MNIIIIPARGGSKGIPRKNLRVLNGMPLIYYTIKASLDSVADVVYVSSDDDEILGISSLLGAKIIKRNVDLAGDNVTLDESIYYDVVKLSESYPLIEAVITIQPTSPLINAALINECIQDWSTRPERSLITAVEDKHLTWNKIEDKFIPTYKERLNRQYLPTVYRETGSVVISNRDNILANKSRISENPQLKVINKKYAIDIDEASDFVLASHFLSSKNIAINVIGSAEVGLGHVYRCLTLASNLVEHRLVFLVKHGNDLARKIISRNNYSVVEYRSFEEINERYDILINDILDTTADEVLVMRSFADRIVNFEDLGSGPLKADATINALYESKVNSNVNVFYGKDYYCLRSDFVVASKLLARVKRMQSKKTCLLTFGGSDPSHLTLRVLKLLDTSNFQRIIVVVGPGNNDWNEIQSLVKYLPNVDLFVDVKNMAELILEADFAITSGGRTCFELASMIVPSIVIYQNERETLHTFMNEDTGFKVLGLGREIDDDRIRNEIVDFVEDYNLENLKACMRNLDLSSGIKNVKKIILND